MIEEFLRNLRDTLINMSGSEFQSHVQAAITGASYQVDTTFNEVGNVWDDTEYRGRFVQNENLIEELKKLSKEDLLKFCDEKISADSKMRQKLTIRLTSTLKDPKLPELYALEDNWEGVTTTNVRSSGLLWKLIRLLCGPLAIDPIGETVYSRPCRVTTIPLIKL